ncbi:MAG: Gfo/Idh/MocA family oxidoreductase [Armatimonadetes bacterium]|nr:Gfo/Idh/MocA family oxidoreductase [Armatimonadota bacterium]
MGRKVKVGLIGTGSISQSVHIPAYEKHPDAEVVAVCDINLETLKKVGDRLNIPEKFRFEKYDDLLKLKEIEMVDVCTPNYVHMDPTIKGLGAGKHVICEKPIALNAKEGQKMVDAAKESGKKLMIAYCWRWNSGAQALKRFVDAGLLGDPYYARVQALRRRGVPSWGVFIDKAKQGGGPLIDIGCHALDLTLHLMGHPKPVAASGKTYTKFGTKKGTFGVWGPWDYDNYTVEDFAVGLIRFENDATLVLESSFCANLEKDIFNTTILGTEGGCQMDPLKMFREENGTLIDTTPVCLPNVGTHEAEIYAFIDAIQTKKPSPVPGEDGLMVAKILDAIYKSSEVGKEVAIK